MKIILTSIGTRGDMEPFLAIGEILRERGHDVLCFFPEQFRHLAEDADFPFASLGSGFIRLLDSPAGRTVMEGGRFGCKKLRAYVTLINKQKDINREMLRLQYETIERVQAERIVHNGKTIYPIIWSLQHPGQTILISPVPYLHYVREHAHIGFRKNLGPFLNKLSYQVADFAMLSLIMSSLKCLPTAQQPTRKHIRKALRTNKAIYTISPTLFPKPDEWGDRLQVLGYQERTKTKQWEPPKNLQDFLQKHKKILFVTFGSMISTAPIKKTALILAALERYNIPAILNTAAGGLVPPGSFNKELFYFVDTIPYDWILPRMYAVMHHGGSGTTHSALKYGCASLIIPHIIDQYVWNKIVFQRGAGPLGVDIAQLSPNRLAPIIHDLWNNRSYKDNAELIGESIRNEFFAEDIHRAIVDTKE